jgi:type I restriction enzyme S subunit
LSFPRYANYKVSGVEYMGEVPAHWEVKRLKHNLRLLTEKSDRRDHPVALENIEAWTGRFISTETEFEGEGVAFAAGDILFGKLRPYLAKVFRAESSGEAVGDFHVMRPRPEIDSRFAQYQILNREFIAIVNGSTFGSKMPRASWEFVGGMKVTTPPAAEQAVIAAFLDEETGKIDELVAEQRRLMELLKEKRQAVIAHAVTRGLDPAALLKCSGIEWLGDVPAHWDVVGMTKYLSSLVDYRGRTPTKVAEGIFLLTARNIRAGRVDYATSEEFIAESEYRDVMRRGKPEIGDVLFTTEAPLGQVANMDRTDVALAQRVIKLRGKADVLDNYFLKYWLMGSFAQAEMEQLATGSTALGIKGSKVVQLRLCLPPIGEQREIVTFLDNELARIDTLTTEAQRAIDLLQERRTALISAAVIGQIDLRQFAKRNAE